MYLAEDLSREEKMQGKFISSREVKRETLESGSLAWFSSPAASNAKDLIVIEVTLSSGGGHNFHKHPNQEEPCNFLSVI